MTLKKIDDNGDRPSIKPPEDAGQSFPEDEHASETRLTADFKRKVILALCSDPVLGGSSAELLVSFSEMVADIQGEVLTKEAFNVALQQLKDVDNVRQTRDSLYIIPFLAKWLEKNRRFTRKNDQSEESEWEIMSFDLMSLLSKRIPQVRARKTTGKQEMMTVDLYEVLAGVKIQF